MPEQTETQQQGTHHFILTVQKPHPRGGFTFADWSGWFTPDPSWTRHDAFRWLKGEYARQKPELADATVLFFALESNQL
ncbi:hypothetical protein [Streptomyces niveus]